MKKIAYFSNVHWETQSSAAGRKTGQVLAYFKSKGYQVYYCTSALKSERAEDYEQQNVVLNYFEINVPDSLNTLKGHDFEWIIYDRFMVEEQLSWILKVMFPNAMHCIETQDFHSLRKLGPEKLKQSTKDPLLLRETAAYLRSDAIFMISRADIQALKTIDYPGENIVYWPFEYQELLATDDFESRQDFFFIGNGYHEPNINAILQLKKDIWPEIRKKTKAQLYIYGAYLPPKVTQLNNPKEGFHVVGAIDSSNVAMKKHRLQLVPLNAGAGLKGKIIEAIENGCPSIGTDFAFEGYTEKTFSFIQNENSSFIKAAVQIYQDPLNWKQTKDDLAQMMLQLQPNSFELGIDDIQRDILTYKKSVRSTWHYQLLNSEHLFSKKYLSLYIQAKNKL